MTQQRVFFDSLTVEFNRVLAACFGACGRTRCDRNEVECLDLRPSADERCQLAEEMTESV
jgi:hypothetical protein